VDSHFSGIKKCIKDNKSAKFSATWSIHDTLRYFTFYRSGVPVRSLDNAWNDLKASYS
jgi:hypothetical protein